MSSPFGTAYVIVNSRAAKRVSGGRRGNLRELLRSTGLDFELHFTEGPGHAVTLARRAIDEGYRYLVSVGGDGTIHEVVNGMMAEEGPPNPDAVLGVISAGTGADFVRTFGLPRDPADAVEHLKGGELFIIDVGRVTYTLNGETRSEYFPNIAEAGLGGDVVRRAEGLPRTLGRFRYMVAFWLTLGFCKITEGKVTLDQRSYEGRISNVVVANAQFFGAGMHVAPRAHPGDGKFDVLIQVGTKADYVAAITKVYRGEHLPSPAIKEFSSKRVSVETEQPLQMEADGEILGVTPATFEIVAGALRLKI